MAESVSPQWPDRCCFYLSKRTEVILTGLVSILCDLVSIVTNAYVLIDPDLWRKGLIKISYIYSKKIKRFVTKAASVLTEYWPFSEGVFVASFLGLFLVKKNDYCLKEPD